MWYFSCFDFVYFQYSCYGTVLNSALMTGKFMIWLVNIQLPFTNFENLTFSYATNITTTFAVQWFITLPINATKMLNLLQKQCCDIEYSLFVYMRVLHGNK